MPSVEVIPVDLWAIMKQMYSVEELQLLVGDILSKQVIKGTPQELYDPVNYIIKIGGKRMRPVLLLMACDLVGGEIGPAFNPALGIELFHNFTLLHDDIMDEAPLRRGMPTVHKKYNRNTAILSGDAMLVMAYHFIGRVDAGILPEIHAIFNECALQVCEGQQYDMLFESGQWPGIQDYLEMIRLKTASLLAGSLKMGALIGGADKKCMELFAAIGENMGMAFQLQDDILDTYGAPEKFGKKVGGDIVQNKKTYLLLRAWELADEAKRQILKNQVSDVPISEEEKVKAVRGIYDQLGVKSDGMQLRDTYFNKSVKAMEELPYPKARKAVLIEFANKLLNRDA